MNLEKAITELKAMNRNLHNATKAEGKEMLREMQEHIESIPVPEYVEPSIHEITIIKKPSHDIQN